MLELSICIQNGRVDLHKSNQHELPSFHTNSNFILYIPPELILTIYSISKAMHKLHQTITIILILINNPIDLNPIQPLAFYFRLSILLILDFVFLKRIGKLSKISLDND